MLKWQEGIGSGLRRTHRFSAASHACSMLLCIFVHAICRKTGLDQMLAQFILARKYSVMTGMSTGARRHNRRIFPIVLMIHPFSRKGLQKPCFRKGRALSTLAVQSFGQSQQEVPSWIERSAASPSMNLVRQSSSALLIDHIRR